ncbi:hypothetical protein, partial [Flavobacterium stagni]
MTHKSNKTKFLLLQLLFLFGMIGSLNAQVYVPFTQRTSSYTPTKTVYNVKGDFTMIGNTNLTLQNYGATTLNNNNTMVYVDVDGNSITGLGGSPTFNSSSADLTLSTENGAIPSCSRIVFAGLYWTGRANQSGTASNTFSVTKTIGGTSYTKTFDKRKALLKGPGATAYTTLQASSTNIYYPTSNGDYIYSGFAEITDYVRQYGLGSYTVADLALRDGNGGGTGYSGGWGIVVVYENSKMKYRDVTIFDGHAYMNGSSTTNLPVSGFNTVQTGNVGIKLGMMASEGDVNLTGDFFRIRNLNTNNYTTLSHTGNSASNFFNSSIATGGNTRNPNIANNTGIDIAMFTLNNTNNTIIGNSQTSTNFQYGSGGDVYAIFNIAMAVDAYVPEQEGMLSVTQLNNVNVSTPPYSIQPGQDMTFSVDIKNLGTEAVNNTKIVIPIPYNATYVTNSASGSVLFTPLPSPNTVTFNPTLGATGSIVWDFGTLPLPSSPNQVLARLTFKLRATTDCTILNNTSCGNNIQVNGTISGVGAITGVALNNKPLIQGYTTNGTCVGEPIAQAISIGINGTNYVNANCQGVPTVRNFYYCGAGTTVPVSDVASSFPTGSSFYNEYPVDSNTVEYNASNPFPMNAGTTVTYYAVPPGSTGCNIPFTISRCNKIIANDDTGTSIVGAAGGTSFTNVLTNDTLNGNPVVASQVTISQISSTNAGVSLVGNNVVVAPGTPAGNYTLVYQICEVSNPTNCDTATVTVPVSAAEIEAEDDTAGPIVATSGANNVLNVLTNDTLNDNPATSSNVTITTIVANPNLVLNSNGSVNVIAGTPNGVYTLTYQICETINPSNCDTAVVTITVNDGVLACNPADFVPFTSIQFDGLTTSSSTSGICLIGCGLSNVSRLIDASLTNYATASTGIGVGVSHRVRVTDTNTTYTAGTFAGYRIEPTGGLLSADLLNAITVKTYLGGTLKETFNGSSLVNLSLLANPGSFVVGANTNQQFDAIEFTVNSLASVASSTNIYYPVIVNYCPGPALECNEVTALNYPTFPATVEYSHTGMSGISVGSVSNATNLVSASSTDFATITLLASVAGSGSVAVKDQVVDYPAGTYAGFEIENRNIVSVAALSNLTVRTYLNGSLREQISGNNLLVNGLLLNSTGRYKVGFVATQSFDEVQFSINQTVGVNLGNTKVYNAVIEKFCAGPELPCNTPVAITAPTYPVYVNGSNTGIDGLACLLCAVSNTENLIDTNASNYANVDLTASVGTSASIAVKDQITDYAAGNFAGFDIDAVNLVNVNALDAIRVTTYLNGVQQETKTGDGPLVAVNTDLLVGSSRQTVGFVTTMPFDEVKISFVNLATVTLGTIKVYNGVFQKFCPTTIDCNQSYALTSPTFPVTLDGKRTGIDGVACVACAVNNSNNVLTASTTDYATISLTAGVAATGSIAVVDQLTTYPAGTFAGFTIKDLNSLIEADLLQSLTISTYNNGQLKETRSAGQLISLTAIAPILGSGPGYYNVGFYATQSFDEVRIKVASLASVISNLRVYGAFVNTGNSSGGSLNCAVIDAINDTLSSVNGSIGSQNAGNILVSNGGGADNINGTAVTTSQVTISVVNPATPINGGAVPTIDVTTGNVVIPAGTPAGTYTITYQICQTINPTNCDTAVVTIPVTAGIIIANDDNGSANGYTGGTAVPNVLVNDTLNGQPVTLAQVNLTQVSTTSPNVT